MKREANYNYNRKSDFKTNYYVDGNTVRRLEGEPEERRRRQLEKEQRRKRRANCRAAKRNREKTSHMSMGYVFFCTLALAVTCMVCVTYIQLQSDITSRMKRISRLESQVADLKANNDADIKRIDLSIDLDAIKVRAMTELGMKYADTDQIIYYSVQDDDYMDQYSDIPKK